MIFDGGFSWSLFGVEHEGKTRSAFIDVEISAHDWSGVVVRRDRQIDIITFSRKEYIFIVFLLGKDSISDIYSLLFPEVRSVEEGVGWDEEDAESKN